MNVESTSLVTELAPKATGWQAWLAEAEAVRVEALAVLEQANDTATEHWDALLPRLESLRQQGEHLARLGLTEADFQAAFSALDALRALMGRRQQQILQTATKLEQGRRMAEAYGRSR